VFREAPFTHEGNDKGVVRQQAVVLPDPLACAEDLQRETENNEIHLSDLAHVFMILRELSDQVWISSEFLDGGFYRDENTVTFS